MQAQNISHGKEDSPLPSPQRSKKVTPMNSQILGKSANNLDEGLDDDSLVDLEYEKNLTKIDYEKMKLVTREAHAQHNGKPYNCKDVCYNFHPGNHHFLGSSEKSDLTKFGVGVLLYFKFIKHLLFYFGIFIIFAIPPLVFYCASYATYSDSSVTLSYLDLLTATTVGSIGLGSTTCSVAKYPSEATKTEQKELTFSCISGTISSVNTLTYGLIDTGNTCSFVQGTDIDDSCNDYNDNISTLFSTCVGQSSCTVTLSTSTDIFLTSTYCQSLFKARNIYASMSCQTSDLTIFGNQTIEKSTVAYVVASLDVAVIVIFIFMVYTLKYSQKAAMGHVLKRSYSASSYTIQIKNLPQDMPSEEVAEKLWTFLNAKLGNTNGLTEHHVVDVQIVLPNKLIEMNKRFGDIIHKKNTLIRQFMEEFDPTNKNHMVQVKDLVPVVNHLRQTNPIKAKLAERTLRKIKDLVTTKSKLLLDIQKLRTTKNVKIVGAFVTFTTIHARNKMLDMFNSSPLDHFMKTVFKGCYKQDNRFYGKILKAKASADPGSILWANLGEPTGSILARRGFSLFLTILLWVISGGILLVSTYYKNLFKDNYPTINCSDENPTMTEAADDYNLGDYQKGLLQCYCSADIIGRLDDVFTTVNNEKLCYIYYRDKIIEKGVTFAIIFVVLIINFGLQFVFQGLSQFERHTTLNNQLAQRVIKTFVAQFLNTGIIILIVNCKFDQVSWWSGKFKDMSPLWYSQVGSTLLSTMFINIFTVPTVKGAFVILTKLKRLCDRGCTNNRRNTKQRTQAAYEKLYMGPEFIIDFRYSQILTLVYVCFLYSGGMPFLYVTSFFQLLLTYYFDKFFLLRVSKLPKNYDESLEVTIRTVLYGIVVIHLCMTIFMYGQSLIFEQTISSFSLVTSTVSSISSQISSNAENMALQFFKRTQYEYNLILFIALLVILVVLVVKGLLLGFIKKTIIAAFSKDENLTKKNTILPLKNNNAKDTKEDLDYDNHNLGLFQVIKANDIETLIKLTRVTLHTTKNEKLKNLMKNKIRVLQNQYQVKKKEEDAGLVRPGVNFIGLYSYDLRLNPRYKVQFAIEEMLDEEEVFTQNNIKNTH